MLTCCVVLVTTVAEIKSSQGCHPESTPLRGMSLAENVKIRNGSKFIEKLSSCFNLRPSYVFSQIFASGSQYHLIWKKTPCAENVRRRNVFLLSDPLVANRNFCLTEVGKCLGCDLQSGSFSKILVYQSLQIQDSDSNPRSLLQAHLFRNYFDLISRGLGLLVRNSELPFNFLGGFDGISRSLLGLGIQDRGLLLHLSELAIKHNERHHADDKQESGENYHPPIGIAKPIHGLLWILAGAVMDIFAMWLIRIRSRRGNSGREWFACVVLALLILSVSLFPIAHGTDLILGI